MKSIAKNLPSVPAEDKLDLYFKEIRKFPVLTLEQEQQAALAWVNEDDIESAHTLVTSHLRLVAKIAMGYRGYGLPISELMAEGNIGLMQAVKKFDPDRGFRLATYAVWWIRASMQEFILHSWSLVKMGTTAAQKKLFFNLKKAKTQLKTYEDGELCPDSVTKIATELNVSEHEVVQMNRRLASPDNSLNSQLRNDGEGEWIDWLVDNRKNQEEILEEQQESSIRRKMLMDAMQSLNDREKHIIMERRLRDKPKTLEDLSHTFGISRERVRQIEVRAFTKLKKSIRSMAFELKAA